MNVTFLFAPAGIPGTARRFTSQQVVNLPDLRAALAEIYRHLAAEAPGPYRVSVEAGRARNAQPWLAQALAQYEDYDPKTGVLTVAALPAEAQPLDLYDHKNASIPDKYPMEDDVAEYEKEQRDAFDNFVGTYEQVLAERDAVQARVKDRLKALRDAYTAKLEAQRKIYWDAAFAEQADLHPEILGFLHGRAYERGHSAGDTEIYAYFRDACDEYRELKALEKKLGL